MSDADRQKPGAQSENENPQDDIVSRYEVVPYKEIANDADLYSFRSEMPQFLPSRPAGQPQPAKTATPPQAAPPTQAVPPGPSGASAQSASPDPSVQPAPTEGAQTGEPAQPVVPLSPFARLGLDSRKIFLITGVAGGGILLTVLAFFLISQNQDPLLPFVDLGPTNIAAAGLSGRLIAKWDGSASYELHIDPLAPQQLGGFSAVAVNPPHPITVDLHILNASGRPVCQKEILFPFNPAPDPDSAAANEFQPQKTFDGDTVQNVADADGQLQEIVVSGPLTCPAKAYRAFSSWDFTSSFPSVSDQQDWLHSQDAVESDLRRKAAQAHANALIPRGLHLGSPVEGDDVIISDNPSHGTVTTRAGRTFYIGRPGAMGRAGWEVFPAVIHFHCDVKSNCVLTRPDASTSLSGRLIH
jgi:hypothetical protein